MTGLRVIVDLKAYYSDFRKKSWIFIDPEIVKTIKGIKDHIRQVFSIDGSFEIFLCDSYLPDSECSSIVKEGDTLTVQALLSSPSSTVTLEEPSNPKKSEKKTEINLKNDVECLLKRKKKKKKKCKTEEEKLEEKGTLEPEVKSLLNDEEHIPQENKKVKTKKRKQSVVEDEESLQESSEMGNIIPGDFHPEYNSTLIIRKKSKSSSHDILETSLESTIHDAPVECEKKKPLRKNQSGSDGLENIKSCDSHIANIPRESKTVASVFNPGVDLDKLRVQVQKYASLLKTKHSPPELAISSTKVNFDESKHVESDLVQESCSADNLLEQSVYCDVTGTTDMGNDNLTSPYEKRKRRRPRKRKYKKSFVDIGRKSNSSYCLPTAAAVESDVNLVNLHIRFEDEVEDYPDTKSHRENLSNNAISSGCLPSPSTSYAAVESYNANLNLGSEDEIENNGKPCASLNSNSNSSDSLPKPSNTNPVNYSKDSTLNVKGCEDDGRNKLVNFIANESMEGVSSEGNMAESVACDSGEICGETLVQKKNTEMKSDAVADAEFMNEGDLKAVHRKSEPVNKQEETEIESIAPVNGEKVAIEVGTEKLVCYDESISDEDPPNEDLPPIIVSVPTKKRRKRVPLLTGLGATLAQLMSENNIKANPLPSQKPEPVVVVGHQNPVTAEQKLRKKKKDSRYKGFPVIEKFPQEGDILAFKILILDNNYEPRISDYIEGKVESCDETLDQVTIKVLAGSEEFQKKNGKFEINLEETEETNTVCDDPIIELKWKDLIQPRLVFP